GAFLTPDKGEQSLQIFHRCGYRAIFNVAQPDHSDHLIVAVEQRTARGAQVDEEVILQHLTLCILAWHYPVRVGSGLDQRVGEGKPSLESPGELFIAAR